MLGIPRTGDAAGLVAFLDLSPDAVLLVSEDGRVVGLNEPAEDLFGWARDDLLGQLVEVLVPGDLRSIHELHRSTFRASPSRRPMARGRDLRAVRPDGRHVWVDISLTPIDTADGRMVAAVVRDVTERRQDRVQLAQWSDVFDRAGFGMVVTDATSYRIVRVNDAFATMHGYTQDQLLGLPIADLFPPSRHAELAEIARLANEQGGHQCETVHVRRDGSSFPVRLDISAVHDDDGRLAYRVAYVQDLTEAHRAEQRLRDGQQRLSASVEAMPDAVLFATPLQDGGRIVDFEITYANSAAGRVLEQATGCAPRPRPSWFTPDLMDDLRAVMTTGGPLERDVGLMDPEAPETQFVLRAARTGSELVLVLHDVTDQREAQRRLEAAYQQLQRVNDQLEAGNRTQEQFVSTVSHELRTPMATIRGFAETLAAHWDDIDDTQRRDYLVAIQRGVVRQTTLLADLLDVTRIRAGRLDLDLHPVALHEVVGTAIEAAHLPGDVRVDVPDTVVVLADEIRLVQVVVNLLTNAAKYGRPPIEVSATVVGDEVALTVRDHGPGVPPSFEEHLFEMFAQASHGDCRTASGTGLGLFIVRQLVEAQGGTVVHAPADPGACFVVRLPRG